MSLAFASAASAVVPIKVETYPSGTNAFGARDTDRGPTQAIDVEVSVNDPVYRRTDTIKSFSITGANAAEFPLNSGGRECQRGTTIEDGIPCHIYISFDPSTTGSKSATLNVSTDKGASGSLGLSGTGTQTKMTVTPGSLDLGSGRVNDGATPAKFATLKNEGTTTVTLSGIAISGSSDFFRPPIDDGAICKGTGTPTTLTAGQSCTLYAQFYPTTEGYESATMNISTNIGPATLGLTGRGLAPDGAADPGFDDFGSQPVATGPTATKTVHLRNSGSAIGQVTGDTVITGPNAGLFSIVSDGCPVGTSLNAGETCPVTVAFDPDTTGPKEGSVVFTFNGIRTQHPNVLLNGLGTRPAARITPEVIGFGAKRVDLGPAAPQAFSFQSTGDAPLAISGYSITGGDSGEFSVDSASCGTASLDPASRCNVIVGFDPTTAGDKVATLSIRTGAGPIEAQLTGTGLAAPVPPPDPPTCDGKAAGIVGTDQSDVLHGTAGPDVIAALGGNDRVFGLSGDDLICGGAGNDRLFGGAGKDKLLGEGGKDFLAGGGGSDFLLGGAAADRMVGGAGRDRVRGGPGHDHAKP